MLPLMPVVDPVPQPESMKAPIHAGDIGPFVFRRMERHQRGKNLCNEVVNLKIKHGDKIDVPPGLFMHQFQDFIGGNPGRTVKARIDQIVSIRLRIFLEIYPGKLGLGIDPKADCKQKYIFGFGMTLAKTQRLPDTLPSLPGPAQRKKPEGFQAEPV